MLPFSGGGFCILCHLFQDLYFCLVFMWFSMFSFRMSVSSVERGGRQLSCFSMSVQQNSRSELSALAATSAWALVWLCSQVSLQADKLTRASLSTSDHRLCLLGTQPGGVTSCETELAWTRCQDLFLLLLFAGLYYRKFIHNLLKQMAQLHMAQLRHPHL